MNLSEFLGIDAYNNYHQALRASSTNITSSKQNWERYWETYQSSFTAIYALGLSAVGISLMTLTSIPGVLNATPYIIFGATSSACLLPLAVASLYALHQRGCGTDESFDQAIKYRNAASMPVLGLGLASITFYLASFMTPVGVLCSTPAMVAFAALSLVSTGRFIAGAIESKDHQNDEKFIRDAGEVWSNIINSTTEFFGFSPA